MERELFLGRGPEKISPERSPSLHCAQKEEYETISFTLCHTLSHSRTLSHTLSHSLALSHTLSHTLSHSLTHTSTSTSTSTSTRTCSCSCTYRIWLSSCIYPIQFITFFTLIRNLSGLVSAQNPREYGFQL